MVPKPLPDLAHPHFQCETAALKHLEAIRWKRDPICPHCGSKEKHYDLSKTRPGVRKCSRKECRKQFPVRANTRFDGTNTRINIVFQAIYLILISECEINTKYLCDFLKINPRTASNWHSVIKNDVGQAVANPKNTLFFLDGEKLHCSIQGDEFKIRHMKFNFALSCLLFNE
ncbi:transposase [Methylobacterium phyllosphaerae]